MILMDNEELVGFARRVGLFWPSAEIYGGASGLYDYGHLGAALKRRFEELWISYFIEGRRNHFMIEGSTMLPEKPLVASGHASRFNDVIISCTKCKSFFRADVLLADLGVAINEGADAAQIGEAVRAKGIRCPKCKGELGEPRAFNMMVDVALGPEKKESGYLRPETAQSVYLNFYREFTLLRKRLPLGLAIIGRAYRNEISPRQGLYRMRELTQAELQIFFDPEEWNRAEAAPHEGGLSVVPYSTGKQARFTPAELVAMGYPAFYVNHMAMIDRFYRKVLHVPEERLRFLEKGGSDKAFYNRVHMDIEVDVGSWNGFREVGGLHYRGDYDLTSHSKGSGQDLSVSIDGRRFMPHVLELSFGVDRNIWMLTDLFHRKDGERELFSLPTHLSHYAAAVFPLQKDEALEKRSAELCDALGRDFRIYYDTSGSIGKRYARMDEIGTPYCITVDFETVDSKSDNYGKVTVRKRDDKSQVRATTEGLRETLRLTRVAEV